MTTAWRLRQDVPATQMEFLAHLLADLTAFARVFSGATNPFVAEGRAGRHRRDQPSPRWTRSLAAVAGCFDALLLFDYEPLAGGHEVAA